MDGPPGTHLDELRLIARQAIEAFSQNAVIAAIKGRRWTRDDYERLLLTIFPQVYQGTMSFALAAGNCANKWASLREFLVRHAEEEMLHYKWIIDDLKSIGYQGERPEEILPSPPVQAYICFNFFNAHHLPPSRLASSLVLEGLGASLKPDDFLGILASSGLKPESFSFFISHSSTDKSHVPALWETIGALDLTETEWRWMKHACRTAGIYYKAMYDHSMMGAAAQRIVQGARHG